MSKIDFETLASNLPSSNTGIICARKKFCFTQNCQTSYTVFVPCIKKIMSINKIDLGDGSMYFINIVKHIGNSKAWFQKFNFSVEKPDSSNLYFRLGSIFFLPVLGSYFIFIIFSPDSFLKPSRNRILISTLSFFTRQFNFSSLVTRLIHNIHNI